MLTLLLVHCLYLSISIVNLGLEVVHSLVILDHLGLHLYNLSTAYTGVGMVTVLRELF